MKICSAPSYGVALLLPMVSLCSFLWYSIGKVPKMLRGQILLFQENTDLGFRSNPYYSPNSWKWSFRTYLGRSASKSQYDSLKNQTRYSCICLNCVGINFENLSISEFPVGGGAVRSKAAKQQQPRIFDHPPPPSTCAGMKYRGRHKPSLRYTTPHIS